MPLLQIFYIALNQTSNYILIIAQVACDYTQITWPAVTLPRHA